MALLEVKTYPDPALRVTPDPIEIFDEELEKFVGDMWETMYAKDGVGLAAPQVGVAKRLLVLDWKGEKYVVINPEISEEEGSVEAEEGCLSFPGIYEKVARPGKMRVRFVDEHNVAHDMRVEGFLARVFAHETDHLNGRLLIDNVSVLRRHFLQKKLERKKKDGR